MASRPAAPVSASGAASGAGLSTREQILQRYAGGGSSSSGAAALGKQKAETYETAEPADSVDNGPVTHSRTLLLGSTSSGLAGKKLLGSSLHGGAAHVEDVDSSTRLRPALAFQQFAGALYVGGGGRTSGSFEAGPSALLVAGKSSAAEPALSSRGGVSGGDEEAVRLKFENPFVKLQRLQEELKEFDSELREAAKQGPQAQSAGADAAQGIWNSLASNVQQLQGQLDSLLEQPEVKQLLQQHSAGEGSVAKAASSSSLLPQFDSLFNSYVAELTANPNFQPFPAATAGAPAAAAAQAASSAELAALPKLDERLNALEKLLGASASSASKQPQIPQLSFSSVSATSPSSAGGSTVSVLPAPDLVSALSSLQSQLSQLNPQRLEYVSRACKQILIEQESIALASSKQAGKEDASGKTAAAGDKKEEGTAAAAADASAKPYAAQVAHLYALTSRWDALSLTLPALISRLSSLHTLHASSATLVSRVSALERQSAAIDAALAAQREGVDSVAKTAQDNIASVHANFKAMDARIQQLTKKMELLAAH